ncbi:MAG: hypothetical protein V4608_11060 [Bacteroidota bacterium]
MAKAKKAPIKKPFVKPKYIATPEKMREHFDAYVLKVKGDPFKVKDWVGKDAEQVNREKEKPLTMEGFEDYLFDNDIITDVSDYFENKGNRYENYVPICRAIKRKIRKDQIEGGMSGIYNPSITQRLNSLVDKTDVTSNGDKVGSQVFQIGFQKPDPNEGE